MRSTPLPFYLDSKLLGARYLSVLCLSSALHGRVLLSDWMFLHSAEMLRPAAPELLLGAEAARLQQCGAVLASLKKQQPLGSLTSLVVSHSQELELGCPLGK